MAFYDRIAQHLRQREMYVDDTLDPIGYPAFLAGLYAATNRNFLVVGAAQAVLGGATCLLVWALTRRFTQSRALALLAEGVTGLYPPLIYYGAMTLTESIAPFALTLALLLVLRAGERPTSYRAATGGLALATATLIRPNFLALYPFIGLFTWHADREHRRRGFVTAGRLVCFALPVLMVVAVNNSLLVRRVAGLSTNGGLNFFLLQVDVRGLTYFDSGFVPVRNAQRYPRLLASPVPLYDEPYFYREGLRAFWQRTDKLGHLLSNVGEGFGLGLQGYWPANGTSEQDEKADYAWMRRLLRWCSRAFSFCLVVPIIIQAIIFTIQGRVFEPSGTSVRLGVSLIVTLLITFALFLADPRMHIPYDPALVTCTAAAWANWRSSVVRSSWANMEVGV